MIGLLWQSKLRHQSWFLLLVWKLEKEISKIAMDHIFHDVTCYRSQSKIRQEVSIWAYCLKMHVKILSTDKFPAYFIVETQWIRPMGLTTRYDSRIRITQRAMFSDHPIKNWGAETLYRVCHTFRHFKYLIFSCWSAAAETQFKHISKSNVTHSATIQLLKEIAEYKGNRNRTKKILLPARARDLRFSWRLILPLRYTERLAQTVMKTGGRGFLKYGMFQMRFCSLSAAEK
jgi:hypothetical protein